MTKSLKEVRFYGILDTAYVNPSDWEDKFHALCQGGAGIVQIRAKKESPEERRQLLERALKKRSQLPEAYRVPLVINDDLELCQTREDLGLHIGQEDTPPLEARKVLGPNRILGLSTHSIDQAEAAMNLGSRTLDYFAVGPVFATPTKPDYKPVGLELISWVAQRRPSLPFFCIGGIKRTNARKVYRAGGSRVVSVSDALLAKDTAKAVADIIADLS